MNETTLKCSLLGQIKTIEITTNGGNRLVGMGAIAWLEDGFRAYVESLDKTLDNTGRAHPPKHAEGCNCPGCGHARDVREGSLQTGLEKMRERISALESGLKDVQTKLKCSEVEVPKPYEAEPVGTDRTKADVVREAGGHHEQVAAPFYPYEDVTQKARDELKEFFKGRLNRRGHDAYISRELAGDFCFALMGGIDKLVTYDPNLTPALVEEITAGVVKANKASEAPWSN